jgi:hypothetical protein
MTLSAALFMIRVVVGGLFMGHGLQKVTTRGGGHVFVATSATFEQMGCTLGRFWVAVTAAAEVLGGAAVPVEVRWDDDHLDRCPSGLSFPTDVDREDDGRARRARLAFRAARRYYDRAH